MDEDLKPDLESGGSAESTDQSITEPDNQNEPPAPQDGGDEPQGDDQGDSLDAPQGDAEPAPQDNQPRSRREDRRVRRLIDNLRTSTEERDRYKSELERRGGRGYKPIRYEEGQYTADELEADREAYAEYRYQEGLRQAQLHTDTKLWVRDLERDNEVVLSKYPMLDPSHEEFNPELAEDLNEWYLELAGYDDRTKTVRNTNVRYRDFIEAQMALVEKASASRNADTATRVAQQSGRAGLRPTGGRRDSLGEITARKVGEMKPEEFEKHETAVDREIDRRLGIRR
jgi:hypothetical protein